MQEFKEAFTLFPWYFYVVFMALSLGFGAWLRKYFERKEVEKKKREKVEFKEMKKEAKRQARLRKKKLRRNKQEKQG